MDSESEDLPIGPVPACQWVQVPPGHDSHGDCGPYTVTDGLSATDPAPGRDVAGRPAGPQAPGRRDRRPSRRPGGRRRGNFGDA